MKCNNIENLIRDGTTPQPALFKAYLVLTITYHSLFKNEIQAMSQRTPSHSNHTGFDRPNKIDMVAKFFTKLEPHPP